jgi:hypothetical protein
MSNLHLFKIAQDDCNNEIRLIVDYSILTAEMAAEINNFCGGAAIRMAEERQDVYRVVARSFGVLAMAHMLAEGGADFGAKDKVGDRSAGSVWVDSTLEYVSEGWPDASQLGITIVSAYVECPEFFSVELTELAP